MSYEGHEQCICKKGHYYERDAYAQGEELLCACGEPSAWVNCVDDTNCDSSGLIPFNLLVERFRISEARTETCNLGHVHMVEPEVFRIPGATEMAGLRHYWDVDKFVLEGS